MTPRPCSHRLRLGVLVLSAQLWGCGATDRALSDREGRTDDASFSSSINTCPSFAFQMVLPERIRAGEKATVTVYATDADADDAELSYSWSATAGDFSAPQSFLTEYGCASYGPQLLSVIAADAKGCESALHLAVQCEEP